jgi:GAF domain-containing protein
VKDSAEFKRTEAAIMPREAVLARTFVELADTLVDDFDVVDLLSLLADRCVEVLDVSAAGLMLASPDGELRAIASSSEAIRVLELIELQSQEGPCWDCYLSGAAVVEQDLTADHVGWPTFAPAAHEAGFRSVQALPMRLRGATIGALNLFGTTPRGMNEADLAAAQALADVATIAIVQHRVANEAQAVTEQLNRALNSRVVIEQAKGMLAERTDADMDVAFTTLRSYARQHNRLLVDVAADVIAGKLADLTG